MWIKVVNDGLSNDYETKSKWISAIFITIGLIITVYTIFSILTTSTILGVALTSIGLFSAYLTAKINPFIPASWSKALILLFAGVLFLLLSMASLTSMGMLIGMFFLLGTINNVYMAYLTRKDSTTYAWTIHALVSGIFAIDILGHSNTISANIIGLYVAINLISDGLVVLYSGRHIYIRP